MRYRQGFTLLELSIVLVIIGLLVGGIFVAQSMIRASELRAATSEINKLKTAMNSFRGKYMAIPGDFTAATQFWGSLGGTGNDALCQNTPATGTATCDGNGNAIISTSVVTNDERYRLWQHLANAGMVEGNFTGVAGAGGASNMIANQNVPGSKLNDTAYYTMNGFPGRVLADAATVFGKEYGITLELRNSTTAGALIGLLRPEELWNIDLKMDDGKPGTGGINTYKNNAAIDECVTTTSAATAEYAVTITTFECVLIAANM